MRSDSMLDSAYREEIKLFYRIEGQELRRRAVLPVTDSWRNGRSRRTGGG